MKQRLKVDMWMTGFYTKQEEEEEQQQQTNKQINKQSNKNKNNSSPSPRQLLQLDPMA